MRRAAWSFWPGRLGRVRVGALGSLGGRVDTLVAADLLAGQGADEGHPGVDVLLVPPASAGGPAQLSGTVIDVLIACERHSVPTVLLAAEVADLATPVAAVCRDVASDDGAVIDAARRRFGADRTHRLRWMPASGLSGGGLPGGGLPGDGATRPGRARSARWLRVIVRNVGPRSVPSRQAQVTGLLKSRLGAPGRIRMRRRSSTR